VTSLSIPQADTTTRDKPITVRQEALIAAIDRGVTALRDLMDIADYSSTSVVKYNLELLAKRGLVTLVPVANGDTLHAYSGHEFCEAWNAAARLAGNTEA
jgi:hypothetical protein